MTTGSAGIYGRYWDYYVRRWKTLKEMTGAGLARPGDEWGTPSEWEQVFERLFVAGGVAGWERAVEIGQGAGKYTEPVLERSCATVRTYDVSRAFLEVCAEQCRAWIDQERLSLHPLGIARPDELLADLEAAGWRRRADAFYSIDAMVHVDLQYLVVYLLTAGLTLKPGGRLILTLADATRDPGFAKLLTDIAWTWSAQERALGSGKFEWLGPDLVRAILPRLGFEVDVLDADSRDLLVSATLSRPDLADRLEPFLRAQAGDPSATHPPTEAPASADPTPGGRPHEVHP